MTTARPTRSQMRLVLLVVGMGMLAIVSRFDPLAGSPESGAGIYDMTRLRRDLHLCGRDCKRSDPVMVQTLDVIRALGDIEPVVVDPRPAAPCPPGPCTNVGAGPCATVIHVRVAEDGYVAYELRGGP